MPSTAILALLLEFLGHFHDYHFSYFSAYSFTINYIEFHYIAEFPLQNFLHVPRWMAAMNALIL